jgi:CheY-like chemotaxis protein
VKPKPAKRKEARGPRKLLVADDSATIRKIVELCFAGQEIEVLGAASGAQAIEAIKQSAPDLVLADAIMPGPDGYELCERIKEGEFGPVPPVVLLADVFEPLDTARASAAGADGHIAKPFEAATLLLMVSDQLGLPAPPAAQHPPTAMKPYTVEMAASRLGGNGGGAAPVPGGTPLAIPAGGAMGETEMDALARKIVQMMSPEIVREVAWEVVPEMSELLIKERMQGRS